MIRPSVETASAGNGHCLLLNLNSISVVSFVNYTGHQVGRDIRVVMYKRLP